MKDILITVERQKKELKIMAFSFLTAILLNIVSIIAYNTEWKELYTQIFWVLIITAILYAASVGLRLVWSFISRFRARSR